MNKEEILQELATRVRIGEISREEVLNRLNPPSVTPIEHQEVEKKQKSFSVTKMLYVLGAAIAIIGIVLFVFQIWEDMGSFGHIAVTLGIGVLLAVMGSILLRQKPDDEYIGPVFHAMGGLLIPSGAMVMLNELYNNVEMWHVTFAFGAIFAFYMLLQAIRKHYVLTFFAIANGTAFIYFLVEAMVEPSYEWQGDLYAYLTMVIGVSYLLLAYAFRGSSNEKLIEVLQFFGSAGFFGSAFSRVFDSVTWQMFYFILVGGGLFLSIYMKSSRILLVSTLFLLMHISYITGEYFADSLGWPISLVILGFLFIGLGYASVALNKKYIKGGQ